MESVSCVLLLLPILLLRQVLPPVFLGALADRSLGIPPANRPPIPPPIMGAGAPLLCPPPCELPRAAAPPPGLTTICNKLTIRMYQEV